MGRATNKLSVKFVERNDLEPGLYGDGNGLYLQVSNRNTKAWVFRFMINRVPRKMGLGEVSKVKLADARKKANAAHLLVVDGIDPIAERDARKAALAVERAKAMSFEECAKSYIEAHQSGWKSPKHAAQFESTLKTYAYPIIGKLPVGSIDDAHVMKILQPIWNTKTETASRVRGRIEKVLDRAKALKLRTGENPARWTGHLDQLLPAKSQVKPVRHHPALPYRELPKFMAKLRARDGISARALEYTILTAARTQDTIGATLPELDRKECTWTVPKERVKGKKGARKRDHVVPLSDAAFAVLEALPTVEGNRFLFPGGNEGEGLSNMAMAEVLKEMGYEGSEATVHGFRSTFKDWCSEQTAYPNEMSEMALAHTVSDKVEAAYRRGDMREKRRRLMDDWAAFCAGKAVGGDNVVAIGGRK
ncbi:tyrosine-type recombinase/integrase [Bradyrhizobium zhanjiangense]|uniref:Site-specific integrase n=1 Tax=Bradyrhizobium zhanjiangense TaxID=1325107 RepID=A0A4Q0Q806_9BRAD|nr:site-specific integrase [Bradyrhizobium zhanjiangense]RXG85355.1 site-specific integrase [Bradyrhizobium zhanjiangense]